MADRRKTASPSTSRRAATGSRKVAARRSGTGKSARAASLRNAAASEARLIQAARIAFHLGGED